METISQLINFRSQGKALDLAIPTPEHYLPLLYSLALKEENEEVSSMTKQWRVHLP
jgi:4,5-DOPA dioxygenase extradiol